MIIIIGPFPPPVHGASLVTQAVAAKLDTDQFRVSRCNTSPGSGTSRLRYHLNRLLAYIRCGRTVLSCSRKAGRPTAIYLSLSGGLGLFYDFFITAIARLKRHDLVFHHHSFSYLTKRSAIMRAIIRAAGPTQLHIALCSTMAQRLAALYGPALRTEVISNLAFSETLEPDRNRSGRGLAVIGYLSNISFEKGIDRFLDLMAELRTRGSQLSGRIAGPYVNNEIRQYVERRIREIGGIEYIGPVFGDDKKQFLASIDLLVFPTRYVHEAQPLVVYEAQVAGVVVSASNRGCIAEMIPAALQLDLVAADLSGITEQILIWEKTPDLFMTAQREAQDRRFELAEKQLVDSTRFRDILALYR